MTRKELKEMMPIIQMYVNDEKREVINEKLEKKAEEQPHMTIDGIIEQIEAGN